MNVVMPATVSRASVVLFCWNRNRRPGRRSRTRRVAHAGAPFRRSVMGVNLEARRRAGGLERLDEFSTSATASGANRSAGRRRRTRRCALAVSWMEEAGLEVERRRARERGRAAGRARAGAARGLDRLAPRLGARGREVRRRARRRRRRSRRSRGIGPSERTLGVVVFRDEETGCHGSRWRVANASLPGSYVELHVEQGPRLAAADAPLGVVTSIAGLRAPRASSSRARAGHAGTTPMDRARRRALSAAAEYVLRVRDAAAAIPDAVATVGELEVEPGAATSSRHACG